MKKGFTLIELVVAVALLAILLTFAGLIFKVGVGSYRLAKANAEIMRNFRAITDQLNSDFAGLQKDGYIIISWNDIPNVREFENYPVIAKIRSDRIYYFSTGDFQSWFDSSGSYPQSNIAQICWGHDGRVIPPNVIPPVSKWNLIREVNLLLPRTPMPAPSTLLPGIQFLTDCNDISFSRLKTNETVIKDMVEKVKDDLFFKPGIVNVNNPDNIRKLLSQNIGQLKIQWNDGSTYPVGTVEEGRLIWFDSNILRRNGISGVIAGDTDYNGIENAQRIAWTPDSPRKLLPRAIKFTFTLYDSKGVIKKGRTFSHIVYIDKF